MQKALNFSATTFETVASDTFYIYRSKLLLSKSPDSYYLRSCIIGIAPNHPGVSIQAYSNGKSYQTPACLQAAQGLIGYLSPRPVEVFPYL